MRELSFEQELALLRDHVSKIRAAGCPETYRLPERAWELVYEALVIATSAPAAQPNASNIEPTGLLRDRV